MPNLPLPAGDVPIDGGDLPVVDNADVLGAFPKFFARADTAPIRDGLVAGIAAMCLAYQSRASFAAAQSDVLRAEGNALVAFGAPVGIFKQEGEDDEDYRLRIIGVPSLVTPAAILAAAGAILAPFTTILPEYCESIQDRWYVIEGHQPVSGKWFHSYVWQSTQSRAPSYPDRLYEQDVSRNGGYARPQSNPGGARLFRDILGREFVLRAPDISRIDKTGAFALTRANYVANPIYSPRSYPGIFVGTGASFNNTTFFRRDATTAEAVYQSIVNVINKMKGHSIRFVLLADPKMS